MNGIPSGGKRATYPDAENTQPPAKRQKTAHAAVITWTAESLLGITAGMDEAARQESLNACAAITAALQNDPQVLDLSGFSASTLINVSAMIPAAVLAGVRQLTLPGQLHALPPLCSAMNGLEQLALPDFRGKRLDLLHWPQLRQVRGTLSEETDTIHLHAHVDLALSTYRLTKVHCHRLMENGLVRIHALPGQTYYKTLPGQQWPDLTSLNGTTIFAEYTLPIVCRHIATYVLPHLVAKDIPVAPGNGYLGLSGAADLEQKVGWELDAKFVADMESSRAYHCVSDSRFGLWAAEQLTELKSAAQSGTVPTELTLSKAFYALSSSHVMVLVLRYKPNEDEQFVELFMDPNHTMTHMRTTEPTLDQMALAGRASRFTRLIGPGWLQRYFIEDVEPALVFIDPVHRAASEAPEVNMRFADQGIENSYATLMLGGVTAAIDHIRARLKDAYAQGTIHPVAAFRMLQAPHRGANQSGLASAILYGHADTVRAHLLAIKDFFSWHASLDPHGPASQLPEDFRLQLLCPSKNLAAIYDQTPANKRAGFHALLDDIQALYEERLISGEICVRLLQASSPVGNVVEAVLRAHDEVATRCLGKWFFELLANGTIGLDQCSKLLDLQHGVAAVAAEPLSWTVLRHCSAAMANAYTHLLTEAVTGARLTPLTEFEDLLGGTHRVEEKIEQELKRPLLFRCGKPEDQIAQLRAQGDHQLADRLQQLANSTNPLPATNEWLEGSLFDPLFDYPDNE